MQPENSPPTTTSIRENFGLMPPELQFAILLRMSLDDLFQCMLVCQHWKALCNTNRLWLALSARDFPEWAWCGPKEEARAEGVAGGDGDEVAIVLPDVDASDEDLTFPLLEHVHHCPEYHHQHAKSIYVRSLQVRRYLTQLMDEALKPRESDCGPGKNQQNHLLGHCMRGNVNEVRTRLMFEEGKLAKNTLMDYRMWMYYGNYSSPYTGVIMRAPLNVDDVRDFVQRRDNPIIRGAFKFLPRIALPLACREYYYVSSLRAGTAGSSDEERKPFKGSLLHWATVSGNLEMVRMLVEEGVDVSLRIPAYNATAKDIARVNGHEAIYYFLHDAESSRAT